MLVKFYSLSALPAVNASAAGSFVNVTAGAGKGMYYCTGTEFLKLDNVDQDRANEISGAEIDTATGVASFFNGDSEALFTLDLSDYIATVVAKFTGSADIASVNDGVVTIKAGVSETDGVIDNAEGDDIVLAKVATTGKAADITLDPSIAFDGDSDPNNLTTVQDAIEALAAGFDGLVTDVEGVVAAHADDDVAHITAEERTTWNEKQDAFENAEVLEGITTENVEAWNAAEDNARAYADSLAEELIGGASDGADADTIAGAKAYADDAVDALEDTLGTAAVKDAFVGSIEDAVAADQDNLVTAAQVKEFAAGITGAMHFRDVVTGDDAATALATITDPAAGDVALYGTQEYVYNGTDWKLFGDEGAYDAAGAADAVKAELIGVDTESDPADAADNTILGAKAYADEAAAGAAADVIGTEGDAASADTIWGARAYAGVAAEAVVGTDADDKDDDTVKGAKAYADDAIAAAKAELIGDGSDPDEDTIAGAKAYADSLVEGKNVTAEGETGDDALVSASADDNKVTVASTQKLQDAVAAAETALQKADITTGSADGTIAVDGTDVEVKGLGSAAYADLEDIIGGASDGLDEDTINGAKAYAAEKADAALDDAKDYTDNALTWLTEWPTA